MMPPRSVLLIITCMTCLGFAPSSSVGTTARALRQASNRTPDVDTATRIALAPVPLVVAQASPTPSPSPTDTLPNLNKPKPAPKRSEQAFGFLRSKWSLVWIGAAVVFFAIAFLLYYLQRRYDNQTDPPKQKDLPKTASHNTNIDEFDATFNNHQVEPDNNGYNTPIPPLLAASAEDNDNPFAPTPEKSHSEKSKPPAAEANNSDEIPPVGDSQQQSNTQRNEEHLPVQETTRIAKINIIDSLIKDLHSGDPTKRRKAIWELAQRGDSRAMQPLVDLLMDADSQQRSLILEALSQIGSRTFKPMNRALAVSLQDDNAEVRKNAIRDLTRMYDSLAQLSQLLRLAIEDPDKEVQETARWALTHLNRIRGLPGMENWPNSKNPPKEF